MMKSIASFTKNLEKKNLLFFFLSLITLILNSCINQQSGAGRKSSNSSVDNSASSLTPGYGRILHDNPIILAGDYNLPSDADLSQYLKSSQDFITYNQFLVESCSAGGNTINECYSVKKDEFSEYLTTSQSRWGFEVDSDEFLQVHTFGHTKWSTEKFQSYLENLYSSLYPTPLSVPDYKTSITSDLYASIYAAHWFGINENSLNPNILRTYSGCSLADNAQYDPANNSICLGYLDSFKHIKIAEDPTIIYHELGHSFIKTLLNTRNFVDPSFTETADLGYIFYDEAGSIGEGISDWFSYMMNQRTHIGEWAFGRFYDASRPLAEDDPIHIAGIEKNASARLSYPDYINYDPNFSDESIEDVHVSGMIISHFLTALGEDFELYCGMSKSSSIQAVFEIIAESLAEMGDLAARGSDQNPSNQINLNADHSSLWAHLVTPINFRRFSQTLARFTYWKYGEAKGLGRCNGSYYPKDRLEQLLDSYGLLLFSTYNENGNNATTGHTGTNASIITTNRKKTVMIPKDLLILDPEENAPVAYVIDDRQAMVELVQSLQQSGKLTNGLSCLLNDCDNIQNTSQLLPYNNGNALISPGELVGVAMNLYNNSNSTMGGVQILANDWDHSDKDGRPCNNLSDAWPSKSEGAAVDSNGNPVAECLNTTRYNGSENVLEPNERLAPVCYMQISQDDSTKWVGQYAYMKFKNIDPDQCLGGSGNEKDCFIRAVSDVNTAVYSQIKAKSPWTSTVADSSGVPEFQSNHIFLMEISPWIPPGTTVECRFRARFTNCKDCFEDSNNNNDDYLDYEYSGEAPFKIIHFQFNVIN